MKYNKTVGSFLWNMQVIYIILLLEKRNYTAIMISYLGASGTSYPL